MEYTKHDTGSGIQILNVIYAMKTRLEVDKLKEHGPTLRENMGEIWNYSMDPTHALCRSFLFMPWLPDWRHLNV